MSRLEPSGARGHRRATAHTLILGLLVSCLTAGWAAADSPQPAQKDSNARAKPKDATLTTAIEPAQAKPGETVQYQVKAKLSPGWHIFTQADKQRDEGPRHTMFDLFDAGGLEVGDVWTASKKPESRAEPAFDNEVFEFFEDEVVWSIPLKIPANAAPGEVTVRCQATYQICDPKSCSFPGRWTLPDASLTIVEGEGGAGAAAEPAPAAEAKAEVAAAAPATTAASPAKKDSPERLRPKGVAFSASVEPTDAKPGQNVTYKVTVKLDPGLHIYDVQASFEPGDGPFPTSFDLFDIGSLKPVSDWKASRSPIVKPEPVFGPDVMTAYFEDLASWTIELQVPADAQPGERTLRSQAAYQICNETSCFPPTYQTLPDVALTILGDAGAIAAAPAAAPAEETPPADQTGAEGEPARLAAPVAPVASATAAAAESDGAELKAAAPMSEIARTANQGLIPFLIASAIGGLLALAMPCVWPMIPITVNFFVKQGEATSGKTTGLAVTYCLAIIGIFTAVGVLFSFFFSAAFLQTLANNPWLNLTVAALFLAFGLSLLGLFEIRLPSFLLNASARGESRGGLIGVFFMALTLTITSFTCTFPVVGGLLVMAAGGNFFYPIIGLATFAAVVALPFFLLALAPSLLSSMPRSGDWMNSVKVVGGLVEIGAALKFLNTAELAYVTPENAWFNAEVVVTSWVILSAVCGMYLLGLFRVVDDHAEAKAGPGRIVFGCLFLGLALYMSPALFGRPPQGLVWNRLIVGILPPDSANLYPPQTPTIRGLDESAEALAEARATSSDPIQAERQETKLHGVLWGMSLDQAKERAAASNRPILIDFTGVNCANCRLMERRVLPRPEVVKLLNQFVTVQLYTDFVPIDSITANQREELARRNQDVQFDMTAEQTNPFYVILAPDGKVIASIGGYNEPSVFQNFLTEALNKTQGAADLAQIRPEG